MKKVYILALRPNIYEIVDEMEPGDELKVHNISVISKKYQVINALALLLSQKGCKLTVTSSSAEYSDLLCDYAR